MLLSWLPDTRGVTQCGLGLSPGADIMLAWVDTGGHVHMKDRYSVGNNVPYLDTGQDYHLISGYEKDTNTVTVVTFSRAWDTCDDQDLALGHDTARHIWAYSEEDHGEGSPPSCITASLRGGQRSIYLSEPPAVPSQGLGPEGRNLLLPPLTTRTTGARYTAHRS